MNIVTWILQGLLAVGFGMAGFTKVASSRADLLEMGMNWIESVPEWLPMLIGVSELLGAIGLIVPAVTRIQPQLTVYAAYALALVMALAFITHLAIGDAFQQAVPSLVLMALSLFVAWSRSKKVPITAKS